MRCRDEGIAESADFSREEEEENTQIQASLPLYFDHVFGTCIGQSQSQVATAHVKSQSQGILPQGSMGFSFSDTRILDSQGFIFNPSTLLSCQNSAPPPSSSSSLHSPPQTQQTPDIAVITTSSTDHQSPAAAVMIFSSPSSSASSPSVRSSCSGTPVLFPSPSSAHSHSPEATCKAISKLHNSSNSSVQQVHDDKDKPSLTVSSCQQQDATNGKGGTNSHQAQCALKAELMCTPKENSGSKDCHLQQSTYRKRRLNFDTVTSCPVGKVVYTCPPTCTQLSDCTHIHATVSIFAIVLQGNLILLISLIVHHSLLLSFSLCSQSSDGGCM